MMTAFFKWIMVSVGIFKIDAATFDIGKNGKRNGIFRISADRIIGNTAELTSVHNFHLEIIRENNIEATA